MMERSVLGLWGLPFGRELPWSLRGIRWIPEDVRVTLDEEAFTALNDLATDLFAQIYEGKTLYRDRIRIASDAVNSCCRWWPWPKLTHDQRRWPSGLDVPAMWGVQATLAELEARFITTLNGGQTGASAKALLEAKRAAEKLYQLLAARIGGPYWTKASTVVPPTDRQHDAAWHNFERCLATVGPFYLVATFTVPERSPGGPSRPRLAARRT